MFAGVAGSPMKTWAGTGLHAASAEGVAERIRQEMAAVLPVTQRSDDIAVVVLRACPPADTL